MSIKLSPLNDAQQKALEQLNQGLQPEQLTYSRKNPFKATVLDKTRITGRDSDKEVYHFEFSLEDSGITYKPGDALGIIAQNPPKLVEDIIAE